MTPPLMESARQRLGTTIRFYMEKRGWPIRRVSDVTSTPIAKIEEWLRGEGVPDARAWKSLKMAINHTLGEYADLYHRACVEQEAADSAQRADKERRRMEKVQNGANGHKTTIATSLGAKLVDAMIDTPPRAPLVLANTPTSSKPAADQPPPKPSAFEGIDTSRARAFVAQAEPIEVPDPRFVTPDGAPVTRPLGFATDGRKLTPRRPPGSGTSDAIEARKEWARAQFRIRPAMRINGDDGILALVRNRFGVGLETSTLVALKAEVHAEINKAPGAPPPGFTPKPDPAIAVVPEHTARQEIPKVPTIDGDNLTSAVALLLETIPHLKTFTLTVDDSGEASCSYTVREVRVIETGGSIKVRR